MVTTRMKDSRGDRIFAHVIAAILTLFALSVMYPCIYVLSASVSNPADVNAGKMWLWPVHVTVRAYRTIAQYHSIITGFENSVIYALGTTVVAVVLTMLAAYPLSRTDLWGSGVLLTFFLIPMFVVPGIIPTYLVIRDMGLLNTRWAIILPGAVTTWNILIARTYFKMTIPAELLDAARVDGCGDFRFFWQIVVPLSKPIIAVVALFAAVGQWNEYFNALIYLTNQNLFPLQLVLRQILILNTVDPSQIGDATALLNKQELRDLLKYAVIVVASVPPLLVYPLAQRYFVKGIMIGSIKG